MGLFSKKKKKSEEEELEPLDEKSFNEASPPSVETKAAPKGKAKAAPVKTPKPKTSWKQRVTLSGMLLWTVLGTIVIVTGSLSTYALYVLYHSKLTDTWAILYLELEQAGSHLTQAIEKYAELPAVGEQAAAGEARNAADIVLQVQANGNLTKVRGNVPNETKLADFNLSRAETRSRWTILSFSGRDYLAAFWDNDTLATRAGDRVPPGRYLILRQIDLTALFESGKAADIVNRPEKNTFYVVTREGRVLFSNRPGINSGNHARRPLVQKFIENPLKQGQLEFDSPEGPAYGFFSEVPDTNIIIFVETSKRVALAELEALAIRFGVILLLTLALVGIGLQFPLSSLVVAPMRELVRVVEEVGEGNFDVYPKREGLGELAILTASFTDMAKNLIIRDKKISGLLVEQEERVRLSDELAIAHSIQSNFLISSPLPKQAGIEVAAHYLPAAECAGDWYGYAYDEKTGQSIFAIADVSGHGVGSAMFTAIIAASFDELRTQASGAGKLFPLETFAQRLNRLILKLGHGKMHATLLVVTFRKETHDIEVLNAGHPFPILIHADAAEKNEPIVSRSDMLGIHDKFVPSVATAPFPPGTSLFMFTDGLIEGAPDHRVYSERRLQKVARVQPNQAVSLMVSKVYEDWKKHLNGEQASDDVCLMAVRAAA